jgi:geranylgeranyl diphosphate synthase type I
MQEFFREQRRRIGEYLETYRDDKNGDLGRVHPMGGESLDKIHRFALRGKMIRGGLVGLAYLLTTGGEQEDQPQDVAAAGAAMELFQSAFLIHDDIMDRDERRRGADTVFYEYAREAEQAGIRDAYHTGESLGICSGDIAFFLAFDILGRLDLQVSPPLVSLCSKELSYVGVAQMLDVYWGQHAGEVELEDILSLYTYKTGRYTFSLPLLAGAVLAGASESNADTLERIGELLGIVFQLKDDELGLYGEEEALGKAVGSDIREGKKTPFYILLMNRVDDSERSGLNALFGKQDLSPEELDFVREAVERHGVRREINELCTSYAEKARELIDSLEGVAETYRGLFYQLLDYSLLRSS